ncbi:MAG: STAS domain-containing protein [Candidatus Omnitrophica bacterium]|nr:STAS domain-containing protein [Candidatus Omnitrophota bacterium]MDD5672098.1 STAS domain-containing protein [Candidatus Omnitrophota bacterium]
MEIKKNKQNEWLEVRVSGRLDSSQVGYLQTELEESIRAGDHKIRLFLGGVNFLSSAGIRILLKYFQTLKQLGGCLAITDPSPEVRKVLDLTGLSTMLLGARDTAASEPEWISPGTGTEKRKWGTLEGTLFEVEPGAALACRLVGNPAQLAGAAFGPEDCAVVRLSEKTFALGLGAFGSGFADAKECFGEFLAAGGSAVYLPSGGSYIPDYVLAQGDWVPEVQALYALVCEGAFARCLRFETDAKESFVPLSKIVGTLMEIEKNQTIGWVMIAETAGLIGAFLKKSPVSGGVTGAGSIFAYPLIQEWISFTPEHAFTRSLVCAVGIATTAADPGLRPFVRPLGKEGSIAAHVHAAVFNFRALPKGVLDLNETVASLYRDGEIQGLLHLTNDERDITGSGESLFTRGAIWFAPVTRIGRDAS